VFAVLRSVRSQQQSQPPSMPVIPPSLGLAPTLDEGAAPSKRQRLSGEEAPDSPFMPDPMPRWAEALRMIDPDPKRIIKHPHHIANIGFKYPKPEIFLNSKNRALYTATWLAIRAHHAYTLGTGTSLPPPISSQQWRNFLIKILPFLHPESIDVAAQLDEPMTSIPPPQPDGKGKQRAKGPVKSRTKKSNPYLDQIPLKDGQVDRVVFYDTTIQLGTEEELENALTPEITKEILWELCHMSFRFELVSLDAIAANAMYQAREESTRENAAAARIQEVLRVFPMSGEVVGPFMISEIPNRDLGLTALDLVERNRYLVALGHLMSSWKGCPDSITRASSGSLVTQVRRLEEACAVFYCQSFFDNFGRAPVIPCRLPSRSLARSQPVTFADSVSSMRPASS
jgi:hypothetical protein